MTYNQLLYYTNPSSALDVSRRQVHVAVQSCGRIHIRVRVYKTLSIFILNVGTLPYIYTAILNYLEKKKN